MVPALESRTLLAGGTNIDPSADVAVDEPVVVEPTRDVVSNPDLIRYDMIEGTAQAADDGTKTDGTTGDGTDGVPVDGPVDPNVDPNVIYFNTAGAGPLTDRGGNIQPNFRGALHPTATALRAAAQLKHQQRVTLRTQQKQLHLQQAAQRKTNRVAARTAGIAAHPTRSRTR